MEGLIIGRNQQKAEEKTETAKKVETAIVKDTSKTEEVAGGEEKKPTQKSKGKKAQKK